jgi:hypothetical protein
MKTLRGTKTGWAIGAFPDASGVGIKLFLLFEDRIVEEEIVRPVLAGITDFKLGSKSADELFLEAVNKKVEELWSKCEEKEHEIASIEDAKKMVTSSVFLKLNSG